MWQHFRQALPRGKVCPASVYGNRSGSAAGREPDLHGLQHRTPLGLEERYFSGIGEILGRTGERGVLERWVTLHEQQVAVPIGEGAFDYQELRRDLPNPASLVPGDF